MAIDLTNVTWDQIPPEGQRLILGKLDDALGFTVSRAGEFLTESREEHPENDGAWHIADATGKFKHFLRMEHGWGGAVDAVWDKLEPLAAAVVNLAVATQGSL